MDDGKNFLVNSALQTKQFALFDFSAPKFNSTQAGIEVVQKTQNSSKFKLFNSNFPKKRGYSKTRRYIISSICIQLERLNVWTVKMSTERFLQKMAQWDPACSDGRTKIGAKLKVSHLGAKLERVPKFLINWLAMVWDQVEVEGRKFWQDITHLPKFSSFFGLFENQVNLKWDSLHAY